MRTNSANHNERFYEYVEQSAFCSSNDYAAIKQMKINYDLLQQMTKVICNEMLLYKETRETFIRTLVLRNKKVKAKRKNKIKVGRILSWSLCR